MGCFATGVTVVSCVADGTDHAITATSLVSVSLRPPLVLVCVEQRSRFHDAFRSAQMWGVSILGADSREAAQRLATPGRPLAGQVDPYPHHRGPLTDAALLDDALAWLEIRTEELYPGGDHSIVVGRVLAVELSDDAPPALVHFRGSFGVIG
ncbi:MAG: reductase [Actinomycetales bacterium]|nr:MAG: reductase [Actinomycetales bacterium]